MAREKVVIGIDPGTTTGIAVKNLSTGRFLSISSVKAYQVPEAILVLGEQYEIFVVMEDARLRTWFGNRERLLYEKLNSGRLRGKELAEFLGYRAGSGAIKVLCGQVEEFLKDHQIPYTLEKPKPGRTKINAAYVARLTGYKGRTNEHGRDAAMLVQGFNARNLKLSFHEYL